MTITIDEAIERLQARIDGEFSIKGVDRCEDLKLGLEALRREDMRRKHPTLHWETLLPGETEE